MNPRIKFTDEAVRISAEAIADIFNQVKNVKSLNHIERGLVEVTDRTEEKYLLKLTSDGVYAGYLEEVER